MKRLVFCFMVCAGMLAFGGTQAALASNPQCGERSVGPQDQDVKSEQIKPAKKDYRTAKFRVSLTCQNCVNKVSENIAFEKGVKGLDIKLENKTVAVIYDAAKTDEKTLGEAIRKLGFEVEPVVKEQPESPEKE